MSPQLSAEQIEQFQAQGVIKIDNAISKEWVDRMLAVVDQQLDQPSEWANDGNKGAIQNRMFTDRYQWKKMLK